MDTLPVELLMMIVDMVPTKDLPELAKVNDIFHQLCDAKVCSLDLLDVEISQKEVGTRMSRFYSMVNELMDNELDFIQTLTSIQRYVDTYDEKFHFQRYHEAEYASESLYDALTLA